MRTILIGVISIIVFVRLGCAQTVLLEQHVDNDTTHENYGPNLRHYVYTTVGYGFVAGQSEKSGFPVKYGRAGEIRLTGKYKNRLNDIFSWGFGVHYSTMFFPLKQDSAKKYPDKLLHDKERFTFNNLGGEIFARINFDKRRGNIIGSYIDIGGYIDWVFLTKHYIKDKNLSGSLSKTTEVTNTGLITTHNFNHGISLKLGYKSIALVAKYRISDMFISRYAIPEFPRFMFGIEIGMIN